MVCPDDVPSVVAGDWRPLLVELLAHPTRVRFAVLAPLILGCFEVSVANFSAVEVPTSEWVLILRLPLGGGDIHDPDTFRRPSIFMSLEGAFNNFVRDGYVLPECSVLGCRTRVGRELQSAMSIVFCIAHL